jgi:hypothetical protein
LGDVTKVGLLNRSMRNVLETGGRVGRVCVGPDQDKGRAPTWYRWWSPIRLDVVHQQTTKNMSCKLGMKKRRTCGVENIRSRHVHGRQSLHRHTMVECSGCVYDDGAWYEAAVEAKLLEDEG